jgi:hypothetical protein
MDDIWSDAIGSLTGVPSRLVALRRLVARAGLVVMILLGGLSAAATTAAQESDIDGDGLFDEDESLNYGTDPFSADTDGDATPDGVEVAVGTDPREAAAPGAGLDTDSDGLTDADEANVHRTDPLDYDSDQDGTNDGLEIAAGTDPWHAPAAGQEVDSDGDGLLDDDEAYVLKTNPVEYDSDADGIGDGDELALGLDPLTANAPDPVGPAPEVVDSDSDGDGLTDFDETVIWSTDPNDANTDNDFYNDGFEASRVGLDPLNPDSDFDGLLDGCDTDDTTPEADPDVGLVCQS